MEFGDILVQSNIFEAMKHLTDDHSLFGIDLIDELVEEHFQLDTSNDDISNFPRDIDIFDCLGSTPDEANDDKSGKVHNLSESDDITNLADLSQEAELLDLLDQLCKYEDLECSNNAEVQVVETKKHQSDMKLTNDTFSSPPPPTKLKSLSSHLKYAYLGIDKQFLNLNGGGSLTHKATTKKVESDHPRCGQERSDKTACYRDHPISDSQWVSLVQVVPKKSGMTVMKNQHDELVATRKVHFPLPFIDQVLEKLAGKSHYFFLDGFSRYMQIHIAPEDQHKTTFTYPFGTFAYTRMSFGLCNAPSTFQHCMISIFSNLLQDFMEVFMDDFMVYADSFDTCLENLSKVLTRRIDTNLVLNFEKCHFMVTKGIVLGHLVSNKGIEVDKSKIDIITSLPNPTFVQEVYSFLGHARFYRRFIK
ncbi:Retrovirus-related Pol polyprotein from transposon 17.6, partial [Mucuna pruriens]